MKKPKIALVYDAVYPYIKGGGERRFYEFGKRLAASGYEVHWYGMKLWDGPNTIERHGIILHGISKARPLYTKTGRRSVRQALLFGLSCLKLLFVDFDVIDCCGFPYFSLFSAKLAATIKRKPLFATWHEVWGKEYWREYLGLPGIVGFQVECLAARLPNHIIAPSQHTASQLKRQLRVKSSLIVTNGIALDTIMAQKPSTNRVDVLYAGRLMDYKNINLIIESLAKLKQKGTILSCAIIGKGPARAKLQRLAKRLEVDGQIEWLGFLDRSADVYAHMKSSKVFVLPSKREGFGLVAIEANASGTPVLTADFAGNAAKSLIRDGVNGYVFEPTCDGLSDSLEKTLGELKSLERSTLDFVKAYDWDNISHELAGIYAP